MKPNHIGVSRLRSSQSGENFQPIHLATNELEESAMTALSKRLAEVSSRLDRPHNFSVGQIVQWKPGLKNRTFPEYGEPAIIRFALPHPVFDPADNSASSPYFQEPLSIVIGVFRDNEFLEFRVDGRRLEPVRG